VRIGTFLFILRVEGFSKSKIDFVKNPNNAESVHYVPQPHPRKNIVHGLGVILEIG
jgi:hypothetical protein